MTMFKRLINNDLYTNLYICLVLSKQVVDRYMQTEAGQSGPNEKVDQNAQGDGKTPPNAARQEWLSLLATADADQLAVLWSATGLAPAHGCWPARNWRRHGAWPRRRTGMRSILAR